MPTKFKYLLPKLILSGGEGLLKAAFLLMDLGIP